MSRAATNAKIALLMTLGETAEGLPALLWEDTLCANGSIYLGDFFCGPHQERGARVSNGLTPSLACIDSAVGDVDRIQIKLPVCAPCHRCPAQSP